MNEAELAAAAAAQAAAEAAALEAKNAETAAAEAAAAEAAALAAKDGKPTDAEAKLLKEVMTKKTALKAADDKVAALEAKIKEFDGIDPVAIKALLAQQKAAEETALEARGEWSRLKAQMNEEHGKQLTAAQAIAAASTAETARLNGVIAELTVGNSFATSGFIKEDLTMPASKVRVVYGTHFEFKDGAVVGYDKPAGQAERTMLVGANGDALSFEDALKKIVDADPDREQMLKSKLKTGTGSKTVAKPGLPAAKLDDERGVNKIAAALSKAPIKK